MDWTSRTRPPNGTCAPDAATWLTLRWIGRDDRIRDYSYSAPAPVRQRAGHARGEQGRPGLLYFAALGTLKNGSVFSPLFAAADEECDEGACKDAASL